MENHCFAEADVGDEDDDPCDEARDCGDVGGVVEGGGGGVVVVGGVGGVVLSGVG